MLRAVASIAMPTGGAGRIGFELGLWIEFKGHAVVSFHRAVSRVRLDALRSYHFDRTKDLREDNVGFGAEVVLHDDHSLLAGSIINSDRRRSRYGAYHWRPLHWRIAGLRVSAGLAVGVFDGYPRYRDGGRFVAPLPLLALEGDRMGANIAIIPTLGNRLNGAVAIQFKLKIW